MYHFERILWLLVHMLLHLALFVHPQKEQFLYPKAVYPVLQSAQFTILFNAQFATIINNLIQNTNLLAKKEESKNENRPSLLVSFPGSRCCRERKQEVHADAAPSPPGSEVST